MGKIVYCYHHGFSVVQHRVAVVRRLAAEAGHTLDTVYYSDNADWRGIIALARPDGMIIDSAGMVTKPPRKASFGNIPFVLIDTDPSKLPADFSAVYCSGAKTAALAARELLRFKHQTYVFMKTPVDFYWNREREGNFARYLSERGITARIIQCCNWPSPDPHPIWEMARNLSRMPKPIGIFAANDQSAEAVYKAAEVAGLAVGRDISIVGVDNHESICDTCVPKLTSIQLGVEKAGELAFALLAELMRTPEAKGLRASFDAIGIVRRASCRIPGISDHRVTKGIAWIGEHLSEKISVNDVANAMECSRSLAELRFRKTTGKSILETIREARREKARTLMRAHVNASPDFIAAQVGYSNRSALWKLLKT